MVESRNLRFALAQAASLREIDSGAERGREGEFSQTNGDIARQGGRQAAHLGRRRDPSKKTDQSPWTGTRTKTRVRGACGRVEQHADKDVTENMDTGDKYVTEDMDKDVTEQATNGREREAERKATKESSAEESSPEEAVLTRLAARDPGLSILRATDLVPAEACVLVTELIATGAASWIEERIEQGIARAPGVPAPSVRQYAAADFVYLYAWRLLAPALGAYLLEGQIFDLSAKNLRLSLHSGFPLAFGLIRTAPLSPPVLPLAIARPEEETGKVFTPATSKGDTGSDFAGEEAAFSFLVSLLWDAHLAPLIEAVSSHFKVGRRILRGNVATDLVGACRLVGQISDAPAQAATTARRLLAHPGWPLQGLGEVLLMEAGAEKAVMFERSTCCLLQKLDPEAICSNCSLLDPTERRTRMHARMLLL